MYSLKVRKIGNSLGVTLPKEMLEKMSLKDGDVVIATDDPSGVRLTPYDEKFAKAMKAYERTKRKYRNALRELAK